MAVDIVTFAECFMIKRRIPPAFPAFPRLTLKSDDGSLTFAVTRRPGCIAVQRSERRVDSQRVVQSVRFADAASFLRWCESDERRFAHPLLFSKLARSGCELLESGS